MITPPTTSPSPLSKIIFIQRTAKYASRSIKDLLTLNSVSSAFSETIRDHHSFNLIFYNNKSTSDDAKLACASKLFNVFKQITPLLSAQSSWILEEVLLVNEHNTKQQELLKSLLIQQASMLDNVLFQIRFNNDDNNNNTDKDFHLSPQQQQQSQQKETKKATTTGRVSLDLWKHILDSCDRLNILDDWLLTPSNPKGNNIITTLIEMKSPTKCFDFVLSYAAEHCRNIPVTMKSLLEHRDPMTNSNWLIFASRVTPELEPDTLSVLLDYCVKFANVKQILEHQQFGIGLSPVMTAVFHTCTLEALQIILNYSINHANIKTILEHQNSGNNCVLLAANNRLPAQQFELLLLHCLQYADIKKILEQVSDSGENCIMAAMNQKLDKLLPLDSFKLLLDFCIEHADQEKTLEYQHHGWTCIMVAALNNLRFDWFELLVGKYCRELISDFERFLHSQDAQGWNCVSVAAMYDISPSTFKFLVSQFPSEASFARACSATLTGGRNSNKRAYDIASVATTNEVKNLLANPQTCYKTCVAWNKARSK